MGVRTFPLLPEQSRFLTRELDVDVEGHWNLALLFRVPPELTAEVWHAAVLSTVNRHDGLRQRLHEARGGLASALR